MEAAFRECVEEERQAGRTVLLSSHILSEVEALCDRVTIIRAGPHGGLRGPGRPAAPLAHLGARRSWPGRRTGSAGLPGGARPGHRAGTGSAARSTTTRSDEVLAPAGRRGGPQPGQPAADAGGTVPAALRGPVMTALARPHAAAGRHRWPATALAGLTGTAALISLAAAPRPHHPAGLAVRVRRQHRQHRVQLPPPLHPACLSGPGARRQRPRLTPRSWR